MLRSSYSQRHRAGEASRARPGVIGAKDFAPTTRAARRQSAKLSRRHSVPAQALSPAQCDVRTRSTQPARVARSNCGVPVAESDTAAASMKRESSRRNLP
jgi:hypothetical protein